MRHWVNRPPLPINDDSILMGRESDEEEEEEEVRNPSPNMRGQGFKLLKNPRTSNGQLYLWNVKHCT